MPAPTTAALLRPTTAFSFVASGGELRKPGLVSWWAHQRLALWGVDTLQRPDTGLCTLRESLHVLCHTLFDRLERVRVTRGAQPGQVRFGEALVFADERRRQLD